MPITQHVGYIPHQMERDKLFMVTYYKMQKAVIALLKAMVDMIRDPVLALSTFSQAGIIL